MTLAGKINEGHWSVSADTAAVPGGFCCHIRVAHEGPEGLYEHDFQHFKRFSSEREAVLDGLREGMLWIEQKMSGTFSV
jgi:hypothetical protein